MLSFLRRDYGVECRNVVDLKPILDLAVYYGNLEVEAKPLSVIRGNWGVGNLNVEQIESAATDAFAFFKFGNMLFA